ncbi:MAG TPA: hypothetical protein VF228_25050 [Iamia sp.]
MPAARRLVPFAVALCLASCSSAAGDDDDAARSARVGETFVAQLTTQIEGFPTAIVVPGRRYDLVVTSPRERIDTITAGEAAVDDQAAEGTRFVAVTWELSAAGGDAVVLGGEGPEISPLLSLVVDGTPVEVGALDEEGVHARWVVVPEDADEIGVAVEYDGVTQTVEDAADRLAVPEGGPELLYAEDPPSLHQPDCPEPAAGPDPAQYTFGTCTLTITDPFPYHRELGWAEPGRAWVVVRLLVQPVTVGWDDPGGAVVDYETTADEVEVRLEGDGPVDVLPYDTETPAGLQDDGGWGGDAVFSVPDDTTTFQLHFARPYTGLPEDPAEAAAEGIPAELTGTYEATFEVTVA